MPDTRDASRDHLSHLAARPCLARPVTHVTPVDNLGRGKTAGIPERAEVAGHLPQVTSATTPFEAAVADRRRRACPCCPAARSHACGTDHMPLAGGCGAGRLRCRRCGRPGWRRRCRFPRSGSRIVPWRGAGRRHASAGTRRRTSAAGPPAARAPVSRRPRRPGGRARRRGGVRGSSLQGARRPARRAWRLRLRHARRRVPAGLPAAGADGLEQVVEGVAVDVSHHRGGGRLVRVEAAEAAPASAAAIRAFLAVSDRRRG